MSDIIKINSWIVLPVFNDYASLGQLLTNINNLVMNYNFKIVIVDDASNMQTPEMDEYKKYICKKSIVSIDLLNLSTNQGNQKAIARGLKFAYDEASNSDFFIIMDSDGEDSPSSIPLLFDAMETDCIVVAKRTRQKRNLILSFWHIIFKTTFRLLIGKTINFGNFSLLKYNECRQVVSNQRLVTSYIGTVLRSGIAIKRVPIKRGKRYEGKSRTSYDGLFAVGFQILTVYSDKIFVRLLRIVAICIVVLGIGIVTVLLLKLFTARAISGWAGTMLAIFTTSLVQLIVLLSGIIMIQINTKSESKQKENLVSVHRIGQSGN